MASIDDLIRAVGNSVGSNNSSRVVVSDKGKNQVTLRLTRGGRVTFAEVVVVPNLGYFAVFYSHGTEPSPSGYVRFGKPDKILEGVLKFHDDQASPYRPITGQELYGVKVPAFPVRGRNWS